MRRLLICLKLNFAELRAGIAPDQATVRSETALRISAAHYLLPRRVLLWVF